MRGWFRGIYAPVPPTDRLLCQVSQKAKAETVQQLVLYNY